MEYKRKPKIYTCLQLYELDDFVRVCLLLEAFPIANAQAHASANVKLSTDACVDVNLACSIVIMNVGYQKYVVFNYCQIKQ